jgi:hypothetical protein
MAFTRLNLRDRIRRELVDTSGTPLWPDTQLNDVLADAFGDYSQYFPNPLTAASTSTLNQTTIALASPAEAISAVVVDGVTVAQVATAAELYEPAFRNQVSQTIVQPVTPFGAAATHGQAWALLGNSVTFRYSLGAAGRALQVFYQTAHSLPADDVTNITIPDADVELVILYSCDRLIRSAASDAVKRGAPGAWVEGKGGTTGYGDRYLTALRNRRHTLTSRTMQAPI